MVPKEDRKARREARRARRLARRGQRLRLWASAVIGLAAVVLGIGAMLARPEGVALPQMAVGQVSQALTRALPPGASVDMARARLRLAGNGRLELAMSAVRLRDADGRSVADLPVTRIWLGRGGLLRGEVDVKRVRIDDVTLRADRALDGSFLLSFGQAAPLPEITSLGDLVRLLDGLFARPPLSGIETVDLRGLRLMLRDARADREYRLDNGTLSIEQGPDRLGLRLAVDLAEGLLLRPNSREAFAALTSAPAQAVVRIDTARGSTETEVSASVSDLPLRVIAAQSPSLDWLRVLDVPVSASFRGALDAEGALGPVAGTVELGSGRLALPVPGLAGPIAIDEAKAYLRYEPVRRRVTLESLDVTSDALSLRAAGHAQITTPPDGSGEVWDRILGQVRLSDLQLDLPGVLQDPLAIDQITADLRVRPGLGRVDLGQAVLETGGDRVTATGSAVAGAEGIALDLDLASAGLDMPRALAFWPLEAIPKTRQFLSENLSRGRLTGLDAALRIHPGERPQVAFSADFTDGTLRFLPEMPLLDAAEGTVSLFDRRLSLSLDSGRVGARDGVPVAAADISVAGTTFTVADTSLRPGRAEVALRLDAPVVPLLETLALPPVNLKIGALPIEGRARIAARIAFPTGRPVAPGEAEWSAEGTLEEMSSDRLMRGRRLTAERLALTVVPEGLTLGGAVRVDGVPVSITLERALGPEAPPGVSIEGRLALRQTALDGLGIALPGLDLDGEAPARFTLDVGPGGPPRLQLTSDLAGLALRYAPLAWAKPAAAAGTLAVTARLSQPMQVPEITLSAPGLSLAGTVALAEGGRLDEARFDTLTVGDWFDGAAVLAGRGPGRPPAVALSGGTLDIRRLGAVAGQATGGARPPISVSLDRLVLAEGLTLEPFGGALAEGQALDGRFEGRVNGRAPIAVDLVRQGGRLALRASSADAGAVLAALGVLRTARGGALGLVLQQTEAGAGPGRWDGELRIDAFRVVDAPVLAELLSALSVVGLLEQMAGGGISFSEAQADLTLSDAGIEIREGRVFGPSMGITMEGLILPAADRMQLQGVVSPIYALNAMPGALFARRGEGLFGFNYMMSGALRSPRIEVNPLSILTPGVFRDLFRRDPPRLE